jgi:hypothetical protein
MPKMKKFEIVHLASRQIVKQFPSYDEAERVAVKMDPDIHRDYGSDLIGIEEIRRPSPWKLRRRAFVNAQVGDPKGIKNAFIRGGKKWKKEPPIVIQTSEHGGGSFVNVYFVTREYGGSEEGGWWYDWYECVKSYPTSSGRNTSRRVLKAIHRFFESAYGDSSSVSGGLEVVIRTEQTIAESQTTHTPHYE